MKPNVFLQKKPIHTIRNHYYYFGKTRWSVLVPFKYNGESLVHDGRKFESHLEPSKEWHVLVYGLWANIKTQPLRIMMTTTIIKRLLLLIYVITYSIWAMISKIQLAFRMIVLAYMNRWYFGLSAIPLIIKARWIWGKNSWKVLFKIFKSIDTMPKQSWIQKLGNYEWIFWFPFKPNSILERFFANIKIPF